MLELCGEDEEIVGGVLEVDQNRRRDLTGRWERVREMTSSGSSTINDEGKEVECEVLFTFESDETKKNYIVYTDNTLDEEGNTKVYASIYNPDQDETKLLPIETEKEWKIIETILEELQNETANHGDHKE